MADPSRTEKATPKRRDKARTEGSTLRVADLDATILLWGNLFLFMGAWGAAFALLGQEVEYFLRKTGEIGYLNLDNLQALAWDLFNILFKILAPFLGINFLMGLGNQLIQHGFKPHFNLLVPKLNRINPQAYFADLLTRLVNGWPQKRIDELMPWNWEPDQPS